MITVKKRVEKKEIECAHCHTVLEYELSDIHDVYEGFGFTCPECGDDVVVEEMVIDRPIYPKNFFKFGGEDSYIVSDDEIQKWCDEVFDSMRTSKELFDYSDRATGNAMVIGHKYEDGEIVIIVAKDYEEFNYCLMDD